MFPLHVLEQLYVLWLVALVVCSLKMGACDSAETSVPVDQNTPNDCGLNILLLSNVIFFYYSLSSVLSCFGPVKSYLVQSSITRHVSDGFLIHSTQSL
jgi:hypothetical protein